VVPNGIPLSKNHHAAFDARLIGIDPTIGCTCQTDCSDGWIGPMLEVLKS
jgi:putative restriction endonuclease